MFGGSRTTPWVGGIGLSSFAGRHRGQPMFVLGNGPSLRGLELSAVDPFLTVGVNRILRLYPHPSYYLVMDEHCTARSTDHPELHDGIGELIQATRATILCWERRASSVQALGRSCLTFRFDPRSEVGLSTDPGVLHSFLSAGLTALGFAYAVGADPIVVAGIDCQVAPDGAQDFYGRNRHFSSTNLRLWREHCRWIADNCRDRRILNCGRVDEFERVTLSEAVRICEECRCERVRDHSGAALGSA